MAGEKAASGLAELRRFTAALEAAQLNAEELGEVPDEFLDPITMELMEVGVYVCRLRQCSPPVLEADGCIVWCLESGDFARVERNHGPRHHRSTSAVRCH